MRRCSQLLFYLVDVLLLIIALSGGLSATAAILLYLAVLSIIGADSCTEINVENTFVSVMVYQRCSRPRRQFAVEIPVENDFIFSLQRVFASSGQLALFATMSTWIAWMYVVVGVVSAAAMVATASFDVLATAEEPSAPLSFVRWHLFPVFVLALGTISHACVAFYHLYCPDDVTCSLNCQARTNAALSIALGLAAVAVSATDATDESSRCRQDASQRCEHLKLALSIAFSVDALLLMIVSIGLLRPARGVDKEPRTPASTPKCIGFSSPQLPTKTV
ncbi:hypothetical protein AC1031_017719 [Aphanomyces cochlioides]|nr:hypothetical protein AC1031_017719 [Aphanomyces cochlioides]